MEYDDIQDVDVPPSERARQAREELFGDDFTTAEAAYILGFEDRNTVLRYAREGRLIGYQLGREWRFPKSSLVAFKEQLLREGATAAAQRGGHGRHCGHPGHPALGSMQEPAPPSKVDDPSGEEEMHV